MTSDELRSSLLAELQIVEKRVRADLLAQYRSDPTLLARAMARLRDEENSTAPADRAAWLETFAGRGAVLYILKTLYVRVLEDQGLLRPVRLRDGGTYETFRTLFPQLGHAAYLRRVFNDAERALPDIFSATPIEIATPGSEAASSVWTVWQLAAPGGGPRFDFRGSDLDTRFIGDLYEDLDPEVKARYALWQTPRFIEEFILDRTLGPALAEFGLDEFRIIDPTCGSGHFLLGAFERLAQAWRNRLGDTSEGRWDAAERALGAVYGADLNEYACAMSRFRLLLAFVKMTDITDLSRLRALHTNVIACDSLIPWEHNLELLPGTGAFDQRFAAYGTAEERSRNAAFFARGYHAVVGNPPYPEVKDKQKRLDYRRAWPLSATGHYSISAPMIERFLMMPVPAGRTGLIVAKSFSTREFGKSLVENVLPRIRLDLIIDTSGASIPGHATPTVILFSANLPATSKSSRTLLVSSVRGGPVDLPSPELGAVWQSIDHHYSDVGFQDDSIAVQIVDQESLQRHPWSLSGSLALEVLGRLNEFPRLKDIGGDAGFAVIIAEDEAFVRRYARALPLRPIVLGGDVRDWTVRPQFNVLTPLGNEPALLEAAAAIDLWPLRTTLWGRPTFGGQTYRDRPEDKTWWQFHQVVSSRTASPARRIAIGEINANSQFVYDDSDFVFTRSSPLLTFEGLDEAAYRLRAAILCSSTLEFWFKSRCAIKNGWGEPWEFQYVRNSTNVLQAPTVEDDRVRGLPLRLAEASIKYNQSRPDTILDSSRRGYSEFDRVLVLLEGKAGRGAMALHSAIDELVGLQEELDWAVYVAFGLISDVPFCEVGYPVALSRGHRPFEISLARRMLRGEENSAWFERHEISATTEIPEQYVGSQRAVLERRLALIESNPIIKLLEQPVYKRRWTFEPWDSMLFAAAETWLLDALGAIVRTATTALTEADLASRLAADPRNVAIASYAKSSRDIGLSDTVSRLLAAESIPDNPARLLTSAGLSKLVGTSTASLGKSGKPPAAEPFAPGESVDWKRVWRLQEHEDAGETVTIEVPPPFAKTDYAHPNGWRIRGKFNIANERFIVYDELTPKRYAWGGTSVPERARLSAEAFDLRGRQSEAPGAPPPSITPTIESPSRCGIQFPLWDKLDELRRLADPSYADVRELAELCHRTCPCDVLAAWRGTTNSTRGKRTPAKKAPAAGAPLSALVQVELDPGLLDRLHETIRSSGSVGAAAASLEPLAAGDRKLLTRALDALRAQARIEAHGAGRGTRYHVPQNPLRFEV